MTLQEIRTRLEQLAAHWRAKAATIENDYKRITPAQTQVGITALTTCAEEVEDLVKGIPSSTTHLITNEPEQSNL